MFNPFPDSVYAERFLGSYAENFEGYRNASLIENAEGLRGKMYMLVHGTFDKTVLYQHSAMLAKELQHRGIEFEQQVSHTSGIQYFTSESTWDENLSVKSF